MVRMLVPVLLAGVAASLPVPAAAAEPDFGYVYTAQVEEAGETEVELWATDRRGKGPGHYDAQDYKVEVERGITDRFSISGYATFTSQHIRPTAGGELDRVYRNLAISSLSAEFKYQLAPPTNGRWGFAVYAEPAWSRINAVTGEKNREVELELKAIVQKNFLGDRLVWAGNLTFEPEWERERENVAGVSATTTEKELGLALSSGLSYRVAPRLWLGLEGRYHSVYPDWTGGLHRENYAVNAGPTVHYAAGEWSLTATWLPQLFGGPGEPGSSLELDDHEKQELRLKISREF
jgi:hypothetical protein